MKIVLLLSAVLIATTVPVQPQKSNASFLLQPYFAAVIVRDLDASTTWYQSLFGLTVKDRQSVPERKIRLAILESPTFVAELIEDPSALQPEKLLEKSPAGTHIRGHFKIGFKAADMDALLRQLQTLKIPVDRVYTDASSKKRNFLINDPDGNLIQFFE